MGTAPLSGGTATFTLSSLAVGPHSITAAYGGDASFNPSTSAALSQTVNQAATATTLASSQNPSVFGQSVTFTATVSVTAPGAGTPSGTVTFRDGTTVLGTGTLSGGMAIFTTSTLAVGLHSITAAYDGDLSFLGSTSLALTQVVNPPAAQDTTTAVASSVNPSVFGQGVTFTATVTPTGGTGTPSGSVTFRDGTTVLGTAPLSAGMATFTLSGLAVGPHSITAAYGGDASFNPSTSAALNQTVTQAATATAVSSSVNPSSVGQPVTFTATVSVTAPGAGMPTGSVTFRDGTTVLGTAPLSGGTATFTTSALAAGSHPITAAYGGDVSFTASTSPVLAQVVSTDNRLPVLDPIADRSVPASQDVITVSLSASDPDGDALTFTATAQSLAYVLDQQLGLTFTGDFYENYGGRQERWLLGDGGQWYFLVPDGRLFAWDGVLNQATGTLVGNVGASYWEDPSLLYDAQPNPRAAVTVSGGTLTIDREDGFIGAVVVTVTASDGRGGSDRETFTLTVTPTANRPPELAPIADRSIPASQFGMLVPLSASDPDGDALTFRVTAQSLAYVLDQRLGFFSDGNYYDDFFGRGERWVRGAAPSGWYFILANGELYEWDGSVAASGTLVGNVGSSYWADPRLLHEAEADQPRAFVFVVGSTLLVIRDPSWVNSVFLTVTASDGRLDDQRTFIVTVTP